MIYWQVGDKCAALHKCGWQAIKNGIWMKANAINRISGIFWHSQLTKTEHKNPFENRTLTKDNWFGPNQKVNNSRSHCLRVRVCAHRNNQFELISVRFQNPLKSFSLFPFNVIDPMKYFDIDKCTALNPFVWRDNVLMHKSIRFIVQLINLDYSNGIQYRCKKSHYVMSLIDCQSS